MDKLRSVGRQLGKGALLAIGLPYVLVILTNVVYGWPCSQEGESKYKRALHPNRVLKVTYVLAGQVDLLKLLPMYMKYTKVYKGADNLVKDIQYGTNNNTLDVWLPQKEALESSTTLYDQLQSSSECTSNSVGRPIVVFVYGGAWGTGDKNMYGLLAQKLIHYLGAVVVIPNYSIFPKGEVGDMVQDLHDTLAFIQSPEFSRLAPYADRQNVILFGHSAGAHLCALSAIDLVDRLTEQRESAKSDYDPGMKSSEEAYGLGDSMSEPDDLMQENASLFEHEQADMPPRSKTDPEGISHNTEELLSSISGIVGLGGVYHIMDHYHHESWRGVEDLSPMWRVMNGFDRFDNFSPTERVLRMSTEQTSRLPPMYLIHGMEDKVVPPSSSEKFASALADREGAVTIKMIAEGGHAQLIIDLMDEEREFHHTMVGLLKEAKTNVCMDSQ